jgi:hypothetical protein
MYCLMADRQNPARSSQSLFVSERQVSPDSSRWGLNYFCDCSESRCYLRHPRSSDGHVLMTMRQGLLRLRRYHRIGMILEAKAALRVSNPFHFSFDHTDLHALRERYMFMQVLLKCLWVH